MRRTSGVNHIALSPHPQPYAIGELNFHRPRPGCPHRRFHFDKLPLTRLTPSNPPIPLLKRPQRQPFRFTKLPTPQPTLAISRNNVTPLHRTPLHLPVTIHLHTFLLCYRDNFPLPGRSGCFSCGLSLLLRKERCGMTAYFARTRQYTLSPFLVRPDTRPFSWQQERTLQKLT